MISEVILFFVFLYVICLSLHAFFLHILKIFLLSLLSAVWLCCGVPLCVFFLSLMFPECLIRFIVYCVGKKISPIIALKNVFVPFFGTPIYMYVRPLGIILQAFENFFKTFPCLFQRVYYVKFTAFFPVVSNLIINSKKNFFFKLRLFLEQL